MGATVVLGVSLLPMALNTLLFIASIGKQCTPGHGGEATGELLGIVVIWFVFALPAAPAFFMSREQGALGHGITEIVLACVALALALFMVPLAALAHMC